VTDFSFNPFNEISTNLSGLSTITCAFPSTKGGWSLD
jgi:hypothetical protein